MAHTSSGLALHGGEPVRLGQLVVAGLLEPERVHAPHEAVVRDGRDRTGRIERPTRSRRFCGVAAEEVELVADEEGEHVGGLLDQVLVEAPGGAVPVAGQPRRHGVAVGPLLVGAGQRRQRVGGAAGAVEIGDVGGGEVQVGGHGVTHGEARLVLDERHRGGDHVRVVADESPEGRS